MQHDPTRGSIQVGAPPPSVIDFPQARYAEHHPDDSLNLSFVGGCSFSSHTYVLLTHFLMFR